MQGTQFKIGDVVQLKSGGPRMTITAISGDAVSVSWFSTNDGFPHPCSAEFTSGALEISPAAPSHSP